MRRLLLLLAVLWLPVAQAQLPADPLPAPTPAGVTHEVDDLLESLHDHPDPREPVHGPLPAPPTLPARPDPVSDPRSRPAGPVGHPDPVSPASGWETDPRPGGEADTQRTEAPHPPAPAPPGAPVVALAGAGLAALVVWLLRRRLPEDPTRRRIVRLVRRDPGRHLSDLARELGLDRTTVRHHVDRLAEEDLVVTRRTGRCRRVHPAEDDDGELADLLDHPVRAWICRRLLRRRRLDQRRLRAECGVAPSTLTYHAKRLEAAGLVERRSRGRRTVLSLADACRDRLRRAFEGRW